MYGMHLSQAFVLCACLIVLVIATQWRHFHPFIVLVAIACAFGFIAGFTTSQVGSVFGSGFSEKIYSPGLVIVAAALIAGLAESTSASERLAAQLDRWRWLRSRWAAGFAGLVGGIAASPTSAFALLTPLVRAAGGENLQQRRGGAISLALAISAGQGLVLPAPVPIASVAIFDADWHRAVLFGLPLALLLAALGAILAHRLSIVAAAAKLHVAEPPLETERRRGGAGIVLLMATAIPLSMLIEQSLGHIPSEPLGGGTSRELVLGIGRPLMLFLVGLGIMVAGQPRQSLGLLGHSGWTGRILGGVSGTLLTVCAAGGLQRLCQGTGMAEMIGERLLEWHAAALGGVLVPFLVAAAIKTLQGSSLVAAIAAAGMVQPVLLPLGLGDANGKALAALAVGVGAMTVPHINDDYFWLVARSIGLRPLGGLATVSLGILLQGIFALTVLLALSLLVSRL